MYMELSIYIHTNWHNNMPERSNEHSSITHALPLRLYITTCAIMVNVKRKHYDEV